jgi:hypothetical protein
MIRIILLSICILPLLSLAQSGPGGVGNASSNAFWVKADAGTSSNVNGVPLSLWRDQSGNANNLLQTTALQQPILRTNAMNGYPGVLFDNVSTSGENDFMSAADAPNLDNTSGLTVFSVVRPVVIGSDARSIISKRTGVGVHDSYMFFFYTSNYLYTDIVNIDNRFSTNPTTFSAGTNYLLGLLYDGSLAASQRSKVFSGNTLLTTATETDATIPDNTSPLVLGSTHVGDPRPFGGYMFEVIIYNQAMNQTQRIIINNYLSAKYNIDLLGVNDIYTMDDAANGNYDHEAAGIGRLSAIDAHTDAKGSAILRILNPSNLDNNEFLMWGHNNGVQQATNLTDVPPGVEARFDRVWRASELSTTGAVVDVGTVDLRFDLTNLGPVTASELRLLIDTDNDGVFSDEIPIGGALAMGSNVYVFEGVSTLADKRRFTLSTINQAHTPLPVKLVSFAAALSDDGQTTNLDWQTASESNNDFFTVERSADGISWETLTIVDGAGNSSVLLSYSERDANPHVPTTYYRLKQTDFNGNFTYSDIRAVTLESFRESLLIYPNPASSQVIVNRGSDDAADIRLMNALGQTVEVAQLTTGRQTQLDVSTLAPGVYFVCLLESGKMTSEKLVISRN